MRMKYQIQKADEDFIYRVWECHTWQAERWCLLSGRIQSACWSPCSTTLLFTTTEEPILYALSFIHSEFIFAKTSKSSPNKAFPIYDFTKVEIDGVIVGGNVQSMDWDQKGDHLAILFQDTSHVVIFKVIVHPVLQISTGYLIGGALGEKPVVIEFQKNFEYGACLSIGWSSGRIQHFPIVYSKMHNSSINNRSRFSSSDLYQSPTSTSQY